MSKLDISEICSKFAEVCDAMPKDTSPSVTPEINPVTPGF